MDFFGTLAATNAAHLDAQDIAHPYTVPVEPGESLSDEEQRIARLKNLIRPIVSGARMYCVRIRVGRQHHTRYIIGKNPADAGQTALRRIGLAPEADAPSLSLVVTPAKRGSTSC